MGQGEKYTRNDRGSRLGKATRDRYVVLADQAAAAGYAQTDVEAQAAAASAAVLAGSKTKVFHADAAPTEGMQDGDLWFSTDTVTNCPVAACKGHTLDGSGAPNVGGYPHRAMYWPHRYATNAWVDSERQALIVASEIAAGAIVADKIAANVLKTPNYAFTGTEGGANEVATAGAKMQNAPGGTALLVAPGNLKIGSEVYGDSWLNKSDVAVASITLNGDGTFTVNTARHIVSAARVAAPYQATWNVLRITFDSGWLNSGHPFYSILTDSPVPNINYRQAKFALAAIVPGSNYIDFHVFQTYDGAVLDPINIVAMLRLQVQKFY
jgi:hypothetical protein